MTRPAPKEGFVAYFKGVAWSWRDLAEVVDLLEKEGITVRNFRERLPEALSQARVVRQAVERRSR